MGYDASAVRKDQKPGKRQREAEEDVQEEEESEVLSAAKRSSGSMGQGLGDGDFIAMPEEEDGEFRVGNECCRYWFRQYH